MRKQATSLIVIAAVTIAPLQTALAFSPTQDAESDLRGARAAGAESEMQRRGYSVAKTQGLAQFWWNGSRCVRTVTSDGRYAIVDSARKEDCGKGGGSGAAGAIVGGALAVGLIAALTSHKKKAPADHSGDAHDDEYGRGYNDGLYGAAYDRNDSEPYHEGFMAGEAERSNRAASNSRYIRGAPPAAQSACTQAGDQYLNVPPGSSVPVSVYNYGGDKFEITIASGHYRARCSVSADGYVSNMAPY